MPFFTPKKSAYASVTCRIERSSDWEDGLRDSWIAPTKSAPRMAQKNECFLFRLLPGSNSSTSRPDALAAGSRPCFPHGPALVGSVDWLSLGGAVPRDNGR